MTGEILVVSCYELGRQPVSAANAIAALESAGFSPAAHDVSIEKLPAESVRRARLVAISVPMHTALQLGVRVAARVREENPAARVGFFGLYAQLNREHLLAHHGDFVLGESPDDLVARIREIWGHHTDLWPSSEMSMVSPDLRRTSEMSKVSPKRNARVPSRGQLPPLERYAKLAFGGSEKLVASVDASRGCKHLCRHCPIVPVYGGKFVAVPVEAVLADIEQQVARGAGHVSFGDPDFLNGPTHALRIARELHARWPQLSFDATIKIEHLLKHREVVPELVRCGLLFVVSAVESLNDRVLAALDKGHTVADVPVALEIVRDAGAELRPTLLPYTPWTELRDIPALFDFALEHELVEAIDPVQYTLRLLLPPGSLLLQNAGPWLRELDEAAFTWRWEHPDARVDELWKRSSAAAQNGAGFDELRALATGESARPARKQRPVPRLTEPWFC